MKKLTTTQQIKRNHIVSLCVKSLIFIILIIAGYIYLKNYLGKYKSNTKSLVVSKTNKIIENNNDINVVSDSASNSNSEIIQENTLLSLNDSNSNLYVNDSSTLESNSFISNKTNETTNVKTDNINVATVPEEIEQAYIEKKQQIHEESQKEIDKNNEQIEELKTQQELLQAIKDKYEAKKAAVEEWYNNEYTNYSNLLSEAQANLENSGGRTTQDEVNKKYKEKKSIETELANAGLLNTGYANSRYKQWENEYNLLCNRYKYTKQVDEYSYYLNTTLPAKKNEYLLPITEEYKNEINEFQQTYT